MNSNRNNYNNYPSYDIISKERQIQSDKIEAKSYLEYQKQRKISTMNGTPEKFYFPNVEKKQLILPLIPNSRNKNYSLNTSLINHMNIYSPQNTPPEIQEEPIFIETNIKENNSYLNYMKAKQNQLNKNENIYLNFMSNNTNNQFTNYNNEIKNFSYMNTNQNFETQKQNNSINNYLMTDCNNLKIENSVDNNKVNEFQYKSNYNNYVVNRSYNNFIPSSVKSRLSDITNPNYFSKLSYNDFMMRKKKYLDYNLINGEKLFLRRRKHLLNDEENLTVNPFNELHDHKTLGDSNLQHNTILNPIPNYEYNKYLNRNLPNYSKY